MSILTRLDEIMSSEINALLDDIENPSKMIEQHLRNMQSGLESIKDEIVSIVAEEKRVQKAIEQHNAEIQKLEEYAVKALQAGNENDASIFLTKKTSMSNELANLEQQYSNAMLNTQNIKEMYGKLTRELEQLERDIPMLKAKFAQAKLQGSIDRMTNGSISDDKADAMLELNKVYDDGTNDLINKYDTSDINNNVDDELAKLKQKLNNTQASNAVIDSTTNV